MARSLMGAAPLLIVAAPAFAQDLYLSPSTPADASLSKPKNGLPDGKVTGQRIARSQCHTAAQWAELDRVHRKAAGKLGSDVIGASSSAHFPPLATVRWTRDRCSGWATFNRGYCQTNQNVVRQSTETLIVVLGRAKHMKGKIRTKRHVGCR